MYMVRRFLLFYSCILIGGCSFQDKLGQNHMVAQSLLISSSAFHDGNMIPIKYSCKGKGLFPPLSIANIPKAAKSLAIIIEDPDAPRGIFTHWLIWNIDPHITTVDEGQLPEGVTGFNSAHTQQYIPPCPPFGSHRYIFHVYAVDTELNIPSTSERHQLEAALQGHILVSGMLMGRFGE